MPTIHNNFLTAYDSFVNEIFLYFFTKTLQRDAAKSLTQEVFTKTWNDLSEQSEMHTAGLSLRNIHKLLKQNAESICLNQELSFAM
ncbi:hypothetical protein KW782_02030 [Candidatus Parcubacteria bacterium]|nr:hypothetical protein [Candidatus Parcubacteria bacterium]